MQIWGGNCSLRTDDDVDDDDDDVVFLLWFCLKFFLLFTPGPTFIPFALDQLILDPVNPQGIQDRTIYLIYGDRIF